MGYCGVTAFSRDSGFFIVDVPPLFSIPALQPYMVPGEGELFNLTGTLASDGLVFSCQYGTMARECLAVTMTVFLRVPYLESVELLGHIYYLLSSVLESFSCYFLHILFLL